MQFGVATIGFVTINCSTGNNKQYVYCVLWECCTVLRGLSAEWHYCRLSDIPNKYRSSLSVLQTQTHTNCPKNMHNSYQLCKYKSIGGSYLDITQVPGSA